ncbi:MAG TPA: hypothetical protein VGF45_08635, partial [Polyangia bacterium]
LGLATAACDDEPSSGADGGRGGSGGMSKVDGGGSGGAVGTGGSVGDAQVDRNDAAPAADVGGADAADGGADASTSDAVATDSVPALDGAGDATEAGGATTSSMAIPAASGGTFTVGQASLVVPKGAIDDDVTITVSVRAPEATDPGFALLGSAIYDFGPDGTQFNVPVALTLPATAAIPDSKKAVVAWLDVKTDQWFPVPSSVSGQLVTGSVTHFTSFAVMLLDKNVSCPFSGPCGGNLDGTWDYDASCFPESAQPMPIKCGTAPDIHIRQQLAVKGTITIGEGRYSAQQHIDIQYSVFYTPACLTAVNQGSNNAYPDCAAVQTGLNKDNGKWTCAGTIAQGCSCTQAAELMMMPKGTVVVAGQKVTFTEDGKAPGMPADYCVKDGSLVVKDSNGAVYTAEKQ